MCSQSGAHAKRNLNAPSTSSCQHLLLYRGHEDATPKTQLVSDKYQLLRTGCSPLNRYTDGNETYTFVPAEPVGARSLTIYRNSGDIVLNRKLASWDYKDTCPKILFSTKYSSARHSRTLWKDNIWDYGHGDSSNVYVPVVFSAARCLTKQTAEYIIIITGREPEGVGHLHKHADTQSA